MLKQYRNTALSRRLGNMKLNAENLVQVLLLRAVGGTLALARFLENKIVVRVQTLAGRVLRGYGNTVVEALRNLCYEVVCANGDCL